MTAPKNFKKTLVTGGAGFIGSHLVDQLLAMGEDVTVIDNLSSGHRENLASQARLIVADILDAKVLEREMEGVSSVFHLAAMVSVQDCINDWIGGTRNNLLGSALVFDAARRHGLAPVVYASSAAVYGDRSGEVCYEDALPAPISPYGADKLGAEHHARAMAVIHGLPSVGLRFFNAYGPRQDPSSPYAGVISKFCSNRKADQPHTVFGDGYQSRDFVYVSDIVDALLASREHVSTTGGALIFNVCTGKPTSLLDLARQIDATAGRGVTKIDHEPTRAGDIATSLGCPKRAQSDLGLSAKTTLGDGLAELWASLD